MTDVDIVGLGVWSEKFSNWDEYCSILDGGASETNTALKPALIAPNERRRAPTSVKMAIEVMDQACRQAALDPALVATVFASAVGDMQITDYMCRTLATAPLTLSPTRFHNSVHNAATGYWSIATESHSPANAISGFAHSTGIAILEGAVQAVEEGIPVLVVLLDMAAPTPFSSNYESAHPFAATVLLTPVGYSSSPLASLHLDVTADSIDQPEIPRIAGIDLSGNFAAGVLPLLIKIGKRRDAELQFSLTRNSSLSISIASDCPTRR